MARPQGNPGPPITVGGQSISHANAFISANFDNGEEHEVLAFKEIGGKQTVTEGTGTVAGRPALRSSGVLAVSGNVILWPGGKKLLYRALAPLCKEKGFVRDGNKVQISLIEWDLVVRFFYPGQDVGTVVVLERCRIMDDELKSSEGEALIESPLALNPQEIYEVDEVTGDKYVLL